VTATAVAVPVPAAAPTGAGASEDEHATRKRRRRRGGKRLDGADTATTQAAATQAQPGPRQPRDRPRHGGNGQGAAKPAGKDAGAPAASLISRIGRGLKSLVTRGPRSQH
jgi:ATP-dependent RNA helicase RhlB